MSGVRPTHIRAPPPPLHPAGPDLPAPAPSGRRRRRCPIQRAHTRGHWAGQRAHPGQHLRHLDWRRRPVRLGCAPPPGLRAALLRDWSCLAPGAGQRMPEVPVPPARPAHAPPLPPRRLGRLPDLPPPCPCLLGRRLGRVLCREHAPRLQHQGQLHLQALGRGAPRLCGAGRQRQRSWPGGEWPSDGDLPVERGAHAGRRAPPARGGATSHGVHAALPLCTLPPQPRCIIHPPWGTAPPSAVPPYRCLAGFL